MGSTGPFQGFPGAADPCLSGAQLPAVVNPNTITGGPGVWLSPDRPQTVHAGAYYLAVRAKRPRRGWGIATTSLDEARAFIASVTWVFAKTRAEFNPHEYVVERTEGGQPFTAFVELIRLTPIRRWRGGRYHCLTVDEHDYG